MSAITIMPTMMVTMSTPTTIMQPPSSSSSAAAAAAAVAIGTGSSCFHQAQTKSPRRPLRPMPRPLFVVLLALSCLVTSSQSLHTPLSSTTPIRTTREVRSVGHISANEISYNCTTQALRVYYEQHSHLAMPRRFIVPDDSDYPPEWHGLDLANTVYDMRWWQRHVQERPERVAELTQLDFVWQRLQPEWNLILEALICYQEIHGDVMVPANFVVPTLTQWPKATWGMTLGNSVLRIRNRGDFVRNKCTWKSRRDQLDALGFVWDVKEYKFELFYSALKHYAMLQRTQSRRRHDDGQNTGRSENSGRGGGVMQQIPTRRPNLFNSPTSALRIPSTYIVPSNTSAWPRELWGYPLGEKSMSVRQKQLYVKDHPERMQMLQEIGFHRNGNANLGWLKVVHACAVYSQMNGRVLDVPYKFVVPYPPSHHEVGRSASSESMPGRSVRNDRGSDDAWPWPEYLWGFPLGQRIRDIRSKGAYLRGKDAEKRRQQLDALGFIWQSPRRRRQESQQQKEVAMKQQLSRFRR